MPPLTGPSQIQPKYKLWDNVNAMDITDEGETEVWSAVVTKVYADKKGRPRYNLANSATGESDTNVKEEMILMLTPRTLTPSMKAAKEREAAGAAGAAEETPGNPDIRRQEQEAIDEARRRSLEEQEDQDHAAAETIATLKEHRSQSSKDDASGSGPEIHDDSEEDEDSGNHKKDNDDDNDGASQEADEDEEETEELRQPMADNKPGQPRKFIMLPSVSRGKQGETGRDRERR